MLKVTSFLLLTLLSAVITCASMGYDPLEPNRESSQHLKGFCKDPKVYGPGC